MKLMLDNGAFMPTRAHALDAGYNLYARNGEIVPAKESACFDTGVHIEIPSGYVGFLKSKSGLNVRHGITGEGVIDAGYTGSIVVKLYNNSGYDYIVKKGDRISQIIFLPVFTPELEPVEKIDDSVKHERWDKSSTYFGLSYLACSGCHNCYIEIDWLLKGMWNYCPNCGAKMDEEEAGKNLPI